MPKVVLSHIIGIGQNQHFNIKSILPKHTEDRKELVVVKQSKN